MAHANAIVACKVFNTHFSILNESSLISAHQTYYSNAPGRVSTEHRDLTETNLPPAIGSGDRRIPP